MSPTTWDARFPGSLDGILLMAGAANVILQLARLPVAYGVMESRVESGSLFRHPLKRTRTTITYLGVALLGSTEEKQAYRRAVNQAHAQVYATPESPVRYNAFDRELQGWVAACLYWGLADTRAKFHGRSDPATEEALYRQAAMLGTTLQVAADWWPDDLATFEAWWAAELQQLRLDDRTRTYLSDIAGLKFLPPLLSHLLGPFHRFMTTGFLPPALRTEMHLAWGPQQQRRFERVVAVLGLVNRLQPCWLRQWPLRLVMRDFRRRLARGQALI